MSENRLRDVYSCLAWHGPLDRVGIAERMGWQEHMPLIETALHLLQEQELIAAVGETEQGEPVYNTTLNVTLQRIG